MEDNKIKSAAKIYQKLESKRWFYLERAREAAEVTIPHLMPPEGHNQEPFTTPFQSLGARGLNNLASKLLLTLLPPNNPFFRLRADEFKIGEAELEDVNIRADLEKGLSEVEQAILMEIESSGVRVAVFTAIKQLILSGNVLLHIPKDDDVRVFRLDRYVVERDPMGNILTIVIKETVSLDVLKKELVESLTQDESMKGKSEVDVYTKIVRKEGNAGWEVHQEINNLILEESMGSYPIDKLPYIALRLVRVDGEDYGPGFVEESLGDLISLERLSQALLEGSAASAKIINLVHPNSTTSIKELSEVPNGGFVTGSAEDIDVFQLQKFNDFRVVFDTIGALRDSLSKTFLLNTSVQRPGERVTAEEIRFMAQELEDALGGVYSILSQEFQIPLVNTLMHKMSAKGSLPPLPKELIKPTIVTGLDALGRSRELSKLTGALQGLGQLLPPEMLAQYLRIGNLFKLVFANSGVDMDSIIKSEEEVQEAMQQQQQQALLQQAASPAINQAGGLMKESLKQQGINQQQI